MLTQALGQAVRWGIVDKNPVKGAQPPRPVRPEPVVVDQVLARRIVDALRGSVVETPGMVAISTGMRRGEILGLRWVDLGPETRVSTLFPSRPGGAIAAAQQG